jgi:hypothetical protein
VSLRPAFALGLALFALALVRALAPHEVTQHAAARPLELVVGAKGPLLPAGLFGSGPERIGEAMRIGERTLAGAGGHGLRACFVEPSGTLRDVRQHDIGLARGLEELAADVERARTGDVLLLASSGSLAPREDEQGLHARRDELLAALGARARPGHRARESYALITLREARGWRALAEGASADTGVVLAFTLPAEREFPADFVGDFVEPRRSGSVLVELCRELSHAERAGDAWALLEGRVGGRALPALHQGAAQGPAKLVWRDVLLGDGSGFLGWIGLEDGKQVRGPVVFELRIDGVSAQRTSVAPGAPWRLFLVDLRAYAGRSVTLELVLEGEDAGPVAGLWGRPMLGHGFERSPLEVWAEQR